jgi:hypothetical protein
MSITDYINIFALNDVESHLLPAARDVGSAGDTRSSTGADLQSRATRHRVHALQELAEKLVARLCENARPDYVVESLLTTVLIADDETRRSKIMIVKWDHPMKKNWSFAG